MSHQAFAWTFLILCSSYVLWKGGAPERAAMIVAIVASLLTLALLSQMSIRFRHVETGVFAVDVATLIAFVALALRANRFWPLWISGFHLVGVATHAAKLVNPTVVPWVYGATQALWSYPIILMIVIGTVRHQRRLKRYGADNSWIGSSGHSGLRTPLNGRRA